MNPKIFNIRCSGSCPWAESVWMNPITALGPSGWIYYWPVMETRKLGLTETPGFCLGWSWRTCAAISFVFASRGLHDINGLRLLMITEQSPGATGRQLLSLCYLRGGLSFESIGSLERKERSAISLCPTAPRICWDWQDAAADGWTAQSCQHGLAEISISLPK